MKRLVVLFFGLFSLNALAQIPESVVRSCMLLESSGPDVEYSELESTGTISDDEIPGYSLLSHARHDVIFGYATANKGPRDLIVVGAMRVPISRATRLGRDHPQRIDSSKAVYSILTKSHKNYFCIASNFGGLGRSGSFQNVRQAYIAPLKVAPSGTSMEAVYYGVRDIRDFQQPRSGEH
ncbi:hypothetical protein KTE26_18665 [Ralstonia mannitolilytica]|uniref:hypothetical protein n=1 Tax=Ralstonia mannitolilytica TaxID=105219 RepID=UPI001315807A|nr:hypothetical protein [Ralstonia mannitolilytica]MBU9580460.1 hypothetical protein [Ralstonia mannitolilytica]